MALEHLVGNWARRVERSTKAAESFDDAFDDAFDGLESAPLMISKPRSSASAPFGVGEAGSSKKGNPRMYAVVNTMRGFSQVYVVLQHTLKILGQNQSWGGGLGLPLWMCSLLWPLGAQKSPGANGVAFFFVLSGLVAWLPSVEHSGEERALPTEDGLLAYWLRRGSHILPLYFVALLLLANTQEYWGSVISGDDGAVEGDAANSKSWWIDWALSVTLTNTFSSKYFYPATFGLLWAVGPIFWFSMLFFPLWAILFKSDREAPWSSAAWGVGFAVAICTIVRVCTKFPEMGLQVDETQGAISDSPLGRIDDFVVGMGAAVVLKERIEPSVASGLLLGGYLAVGIYSYAIANAIEQGFDYERYQFSGNWWLYSALLPPVRSIGFACCVVGAHHVAKGPAFRLPRYLLLTNPLFQGFGTMSYSVYVWHHLALSATFDGSAANGYVGLQPTFWRILFVFAFQILPLVLVSFKYIERGKFGDYPQAEEDIRALLGCVQR